MGELLLSAKALAVLETGYAELTDEGVRTLAEGLRKGGNTLHTLGLQGNCISELGLLYLCDTLENKTTKHVRSLRLQWNVVGDAGCVHVARLLSFHLLVELDLSYNEIGDMGAAELADGLAYCDSLTALSVKANRITSAGAQALASALASNNVLYRLNLDMNGIADEGARALAGVLASNSVLKLLTLLGNPIDDATVLATIQAALTDRAVIQATQHVPERARPGLLSTLGADRELARSPVRLAASRIFTCPSDRITML